MLQHSGVRINSYREYRNWGSVTNLFYEVLLWLIKWVFWFTVLHAIGGMAMASAVFSAAMLWFVLVWLSITQGMEKVKQSIWKELILTEAIW